MPCLLPETYYRADPALNDGRGGLTKSRGKALFLYGASGGELNTVTVACGRCVGCRLDYAMDWSVRCVHELQTSGSGCFVTLTYDNAHLPEDRSLRYRDFQLFMHRVRNAGFSPRFFMCGEYGDEFGRPHYHAILFRYVPGDCKFWRLEGKIKLYTSDELSDLWGNGFVSVGEVTRHSASYVARYSLKKITGDNASEAYGGRAPPFSHASNRPGIGADWFFKYYRDVYPHDNIVIEGKTFRVPRYYRKLYERIDEEGFERVSAEHVRLAKEASADLAAEVELNKYRVFQRWEHSVLNSKNSGRNSKL